jgi:hypothetical protein
VGKAKVTIQDIENRLWVEVELAGKGSGRRWVGRTDFHARGVMYNTGGSLSPECSSDALEPVQHPFQQGQVGMVASLCWPVDDDQVLVGHIADQDPDDAEGR